MKIAELASQLAADHNITKAQATHIVNNIGVILMNDLLQNGRTSCFGLGHLVKVERAERTSRNPHTGEAIQIPAKVTVKYKVSASLKKSVNA